MGVGVGVNNNDASKNGFGRVELREGVHQTKDSCSVVEGGSVVHSPCMCVSSGMGHPTQALRRHACSKVSLCLISCSILAVVVGLCVAGTIWQLLLQACNLLPLRPVSLSPVSDIDA